MSTLAFHNNYHRSNHHTVPMSGFPDSGNDPIASEKYKFQGLFYNVFKDSDENTTGLSNSYNWWSTYVTVSSNYVDWGKYPTTYTTVKSNSANWQNNNDFYTTFNTYSANWNSMYQTYIENVVSWKEKFDGFEMFSDVAQINTRQKNFATEYQYFDKIENIVWDLSASQVAIFSFQSNVNIYDFVGGKKGGIYNLMIISDASCVPELTVTFNYEKFKFPQNGTNVFTNSGLYLRKFEFLCDGENLIGKCHTYEIVIEERLLYYSGQGITLYENGLRSNPIILEPNQIIDPALISGLTIQGGEPYNSSPSVTVDVNSKFNREFVFLFSAIGAMSAISPYGQLGSQDRIEIKDPDITAINALSTINTVVLPKCDIYDKVEITTKAYGYISKILVNDEETKNFVFNPNGYQNHEMGHILLNKPVYNTTRMQEVFVDFKTCAPVSTNYLSSGILLWLDAMDYSTVDFQNINFSNYITSLSSKLSGDSVYFTSSTSTSSYYNTFPKQSFNYSLSSTHYKDLVLSGNKDFLTFTLLTPANSSKNMEWLWANGDYGIFKIPQTYSLGIGTPSNYYIHEYGRVNRNEPICIATRYTKRYNVQETFINGGSIISQEQMYPVFDSSNNYTMIGGLNPLTGFSNYKLHEFIMYEGYKNNNQINEINQYLLDKWKFL